MYFWVYINLFNKLLITFHYQKLRIIYSVYFLNMFCLRISRTVAPRLKFHLKMNSSKKLMYNNNYNIIIITASHSQIYVAFFFLKVLPFHYALWSSLFVVFSFDSLISQFVFKHLKYHQYFCSLF